MISKPQDRKSIEKIASHYKHVLNASSGIQAERSRWYDVPLHAML